MILIGDTGFLQVSEQWGNVPVSAVNNTITSKLVKFNITFKGMAFICIITLHDTGLGQTKLERPVGFINSINTQSFTIYNFSEESTGNNDYYWIVAGF